MVEMEMPIGREKWAIFQRRSWILWG